MKSDGTCEDDERAAVESEHVQNAPDGCGCAEMWEHLSEQRAARD